MHHVAVKVVVVLAWLAALGFWWATAFKQTLLWMDADHFFKDAVLLSLLAFLTKFCGCCGRMDMMGGKMCSHNMGCQCGDCGMCK